jgi:hypothetical protein
MFEHWLIELIGHASGFSGAQLKQIEKSLPATKAVLDLLNRARPIIEQAQNLYTQAEPLIEEAKRGVADYRPCSANFDRRDFASCGPGSLPSGSCRNCTSQA